MPTDAASANAMFDSAFSAAARYGVSLDKVRSTRPLPGRPSTPVAFYGSKQTTLTLEGVSVPATVAVGVIEIDGKVKAVQFTGVGSFQQHVK